MDVIDEENVRFGIWDYLVLASTLIVSSGIGIYYRFTGGKQRTAEEYLLGDKNMSVVREEQYDFKFSRLRFTV